jgi:hypothetical protein
MFSTVNSVKEYTGYDVALDLIKRAQAIVEIYIGRDEIDILDPADLLLLDKITSYQTAYMIDNEDIVYKQIGVTSQGGQSTSSVTFDPRLSAPWMAPLAVIASKGLTFNRSKSFRTGRIFQLPARIDWKKS